MTSTDYDPFDFGLFGYRLRRTYKANVFTHLFSIPKYLFRLYKALHPEDEETKEEDLTVTTLCRVLANHVYNDLGFWAGDRLLILMEAQTNWTYNIVPRLLIYLLEALKFHYARIDADLYGEAEVPFPQIELYVLCPSAGKDVPDVVSIKKNLRKGLPSGIDCEVRVLRDGAPGDMINQYVRFTQVGDEQVKKYGRTQRAIVEIIENCVKNDILAEYLNEMRAEAMDAITLLFDDYKALERMKKEERDKERESIVRNLIRMGGLTLDKIAEAVGIPVVQVEDLANQMDLA